MKRTGKKDYFKPGSYIVFVCKAGFKVFSTLPLYTYCMADGHWSHVADCYDEKNPPKITTRSMMIA